MTYALAAIPLGSLSVVHCWDPSCSVARPHATSSWPRAGKGSPGLWAPLQVIQQPPKPGTLLRPPQVTLTQTPMVALRQPHSRIVLTTPQHIQLNQLQPGEAAPLAARAGGTPAPGAGG